MRRASYPDSTLVCPKYIKQSPSPTDPFSVLSPKLLLTEDAFSQANLAPVCLSDGKHAYHPSSLHFRIPHHFGHATTHHQLGPIRKNHLALLIRGAAGRPGRRGPRRGRGRGAGESRE